MPERLSEWPWPRGAKERRQRFSSALEEVFAERRANNQTIDSSVMFEAAERCDVTYDWFMRETREYRRLRGYARKSRSMR